MASNRPIKDINAPELLAVLRKIESRGAHEKAQRAREYVGRVYILDMPFKPGALNVILAAI
ncbi:phage integrase central domain-containing protein [Nitrosomonas communis]|uniref:phage integrase central domain-containing protein n=1 Tax=Nitrosomonas communis TaxID=44574 RepID=UPI00210B00A8|nr:hypothetical protein [Nitrosomonas communis]